MMPERNPNMLEASMADYESEATASGDLRVLVGDLRGRMRAHENRMDRHESWVGDEFSALETKIDNNSNIATAGVALGSGVTAPTAPYVNNNNYPSP
jgi:hypothetical protein